MLKRKHVEIGVGINDEPCLQEKRISISGDGFDEILRKCGYAIGENNTANKIEVDEAVFVRNLTRKLHAEEVRVKFVEELEELFEDEVRFKWSLLPTITSSCKSGRNACQDSLFHLLLGINVLQECVSKLLLEKLAVYALCESNELFHASEGKSIASMILLQFRWLSELINGSDLSAQLFDLIQVTPIEIQRDIISILPDILKESDHAHIANKLTKILHENSELNVTILNSLTNLFIDSETLEMVRKEVIKALPNSKQNDMPEIIRFILMDLKPQNMFTTISELRDNLIISPMFDSAIFSTPVASQIDASIDHSNVLKVINTIRLSFQVQLQLSNSWIKMLDKVQGHKKYQPFDILILLVLHPLVVHQKKVEKMIYKKIQNGELCEDVLNETFRSHHYVLQEFSSSLINLASVLLKSTDSSVSFGESLYLKTFLWCDIFVRQEVVTMLVCHVTNGTISEINSALDTLLTLVKYNASKMTSFSMFIKSFMDYFDCLSLSQIRKIYEMLCFLSCHGRQGDAGLEDDILIIIRKQLMHKDIKYRKMGVIGALMAAKIVCIQAYEDESPELSANSNSAKKCEMTISLLNLVKQSVANLPEAEGLFYDELSHLINEGTLTYSIDEWAEINILENFEDNYIVDVPKDIKDLCGSESKLEFGIDEEPIALNLHAILKRNLKEKPQRLSFSESLQEHRISRSKTHVEKRDLDLPMVLNLLQDFTCSPGPSSKLDPFSPILLSPTVRLLRIKKQKYDGSVSTIDALLGCPIVVPELKHRKFSLLPVDQKHFILDSIFHCINWIRENINSFVLVDHNDIRLQVLLRLQLLTRLHELLYEYLQYVEDYVPPSAHFDYENVNFSFSKAASSKSKKKKKKGKQLQKKINSYFSQRNKSRSFNTSLDSVDTNLDKSSNKTMDSDLDNSEVSLVDNKILDRVKVILQPFYRELDIDVFRLVQLGITFRKPCDPFSGERQHDMALHPSELEYLLQDLLFKLKHRLISIKTSSKMSHQETGFANFDLLTSNAALVRVCIEHLPAFCQALEECRNYLQGTSGKSRDSQQISTCMSLLFKVLTSFFSWKGFILNENIPQYKEALKGFGSRVAQVSEDSSLDELIAVAVNYLLKFHDSVSSLTCASDLIKLLEALLTFSVLDEPKNRVSELAKYFLQRNWNEIKEKEIPASDANQCIQVILETYLKFSPDALQSLDHLSSMALPKLLNEDSESEDEIIFKTLTKSSLPSYHKIMLASLKDERKIYYNTKRDGSAEELLPWTLSIKIFHSLISLIKTHDSRSMIHASLIHGRQFLNQFLKNGMPLLDQHFSSCKTEILSIVKCLQKSTRYMQHVCSHTKVSKDMKLTQQVPHIKRTLECFLYRVKIMLSVNSCEDAFWIGNLKHRDLKGKEIQGINYDSDASSSDSASTIPLDSNATDDED